MIVGKGKKIMLKKREMGGEGGVIQGRKMKNDPRTFQMDEKRGKKKESTQKMGCMRLVMLLLLLLFVLWWVSCIVLWELNNLKLLLPLLLWERGHCDELAICLIIVLRLKERLRLKQCHLTTRLGKENV